MTSGTINKQFSCFPLYCFFFVRMNWQKTSVLLKRKLKKLRDWSINEIMQYLITGYSSSWHNFIFLIVKVATSSIYMARLEFDYCFGQKVWLSYSRPSQGDDKSVLYPCLVTLLYLAVWKRHYTIGPIYLWENQQNKHTINTRKEVLKCYSALRFSQTIRHLFLP